MEQGDGIYTVSKDFLYHLVFFLSLMALELSTQWRSWENSRGRGHKQEPGLHLL